MEQSEHSRKITEILTEGTDLMLGNGKQEVKGNKEIMQDFHNISNIHINIKLPCRFNLDKSTILSNLTCLASVLKGNNQ